MGTSVMTSLHVMVFSAIRFYSLKWPHSFTKFTIVKAKVTKAVLQNTAKDDKGPQMDVLNTAKNDKGLGIIP